MSTTPERKPLLSDEEIERLSKEVGPDGFLWEPGTARAVRRFYESSIDRGELFTKEEHQRIVREREDNAMFRWSDP